MRASILSSSLSSAGKRMYKEQSLSVIARQKLSSFGSVSRVPLRSRLYWASRSRLRRSLDLSQRCNRRAFEGSLCSCDTAQEISRLSFETRSSGQKAFLVDPPFVAVRAAALAHVRQRLAPAGADGDCKSHFGLSCMTSSSCPR